MPRVLLVDDDPQSLESTRKILELSHYEVVCAYDGQMALEKIRSLNDSDGYDVVVTDVRMPRLGGLEFLRALSLCGDETPVILMTAFGRVEDAVWAMKLGAVDFLTKPFKRQQLLSSVDSVLKRGRKKRSERDASSRSALSYQERLVGDSPLLSKLREEIRRISATSASVLLTGESGTGKDLVARVIHEQSLRKDKPFVALNCAAVPEQLIESELFGFEKGAFTGATGIKEGLFQSAHQGTLLLDEIGDMPLLLQSKLLRVLQEGEVRRLGATESKKVDVRVIAATNRDLHEAVKLGKFREDLLYRLEVIAVRVPSLRERRSDIKIIAESFLKEAAQRHDKKVHGFTREVEAVLLAHEWPGNVRELANVVERAVVFSMQEYIVLADLPTHLGELAKRGGVQTEERSTAVSQKIEVPIGTSLKDMEELMIRKTLEATDGDKNMTAKLLGINSRTIYRKLDGK